MSCWYRAAVGPHLCPLCDLRRKEQGEQDAEGNKEFACHVDGDGEESEVLVVFDDVCAVPRTAVGPLL